MLWKTKIETIGIRYLPKEYQLLYNARQLLMSKSYGVDNAISNVPDKFKKDPGLLYDRLKWRRKRGRVDSSLEILLEINNDGLLSMNNDDKSLDESFKQADIALINIVEEITSVIARKHTKIFLTLILIIPLL